MHYLKKIDAVRANQGISMGKLAKKAGLSVSTLKALFGGERTNANVETVCILCEALNISVAEVFAEEDETVIVAKKDDILLFQSIRNKPAKAKAALLELLQYIVT